MSDVLYGDEYGDEYDDEYDDGQYGEYDQFDQFELEMLDKKIFNDKIIATLAVLAILIIGAFILFSIATSDDDTKSTGDVDYVDGIDYANVDTGGDYVDTGGGDGTGGSQDTLVDPSYMSLKISGDSLNDMVEGAINCPSGWLLIIQGVIGGYNSKVNDSYASMTMSKFIYHHYGIQRLEGMLLNLTDSLYVTGYDTIIMDCTYKCVEPDTVLDFDPWYVEIKTLYGWLPVDGQCSFPPTDPNKYLGHRDGDYYPAPELAAVCTANSRCEGYLDFSPGNPVGLILTDRSNPHPGCTPSTFRYKADYLDQIM